MRERRNNMLTVKQKLEHLQKIGFNGDLSEIEKMYKGEKFDRNNKEYQRLVLLSEKYCARFTELSGLIARSNNSIERDNLIKEKNTILDILFPGHGPIFGGGDGLFTIIGIADLNGFNYINNNVHFNGSSLVQLEDYVFVATKVDFGSKDVTERLGKIEVKRDTWIGSNVKVSDNVLIGEQSVIGMGSVIVPNTKLAPNMISFGNPCHEYKLITDDYETKVKTPPEEAKLSRDEIAKIVAHVRNLGIDGDFTEYLKSLNYEKYNTLEPTIAQIYDLSHRCCSEYNMKDISIRRRKEILDILFPIHGNNLIVGDDIFVDCIGTVKIGSNVKIGNNPVLAGNITISDNVTIGNNVILQTTGHEINYKGRRLSADANGNLCEISVPGYILIKPELFLRDGTKVIPNQVVSHNSEVGEILKHSH
jgi:acetyltransferase-like isoleucine patch superfamily enzyme